MIPLSQPHLTSLEGNYLWDAWESGWISGTGEYITKFEKALAKRVNRGYCIAVSNGTVALELALQALGIGAGDEVIVPALTFVAPAAAVKAVGATPVFADIHLDHWTLDPKQVEAQITPHTKAVIAVDVLGHPCDYHKLIGLCSTRGITVIEDAAEAHGAAYKGDPVGCFGMITTFSMHANKAVSAGELGAVLTDNAKLADKMRLIANHGMTKERPYWHEVVGHNYRTNNLTAAVGLGQVQRWDELTEARREVAAWYDAQMEWLDIEARPVAKWATESTWLYTLAHPERDRIVDMLRAADIDARAIWTALPDLPPYQDGVRGEYPVARRIAAHAFWLPTFYGLRKKDVKFIVGVLGDALRKVEKVGA
jgi:perosamine synthetase